MVRYKGYERYKDSGVEWIGSIPEHWQVTRLKFTTKDSLMYGANESAELEDINLPRYIRITDIGDDGNLRNDTFKSMEIEKAKDYLLEDNDILFARSGATVGKTYMYTSTIGLACFAGYLIRYRASIRVANSKYIYYLTKTHGYEDWISINTVQATIQNVSAEKYKNLDIPLPNLKEQLQISEFLEQKTTDIDTLISDKEKIITLLEEKKQAIISKAVTKGLNPNVKMKDSSIECIGAVPEHWCIKKLKYICYMKGRIGWQGLKQSEFTEEGPYLITGMNFKNGKINWNEVYHITEERYNEAPQIQLKVGDVLMTKDGTIGKLLYIDYLPGKTSVNSHLLVMRPQNNDFTSEFLYYSLHADYFKKYVQQVKTGTTFFGITQEAVSNFILILPPLKEQEGIVKFVAEKLKEIDEVKEIIQNQNVKLKEYRQSLITEVVTGKIDVRNFFDTP